MTFAELEQAVLNLQAAINNGTATLAQIEAVLLQIGSYMRNNPGAAGAFIAGFPLVNWLHALANVGQNMVAGEAAADWGATLARQLANYRLSASTLAAIRQALLSAGFSFALVALIMSIMNKKAKAAGITPISPGVPIITSPANPDGLPPLGPPDPTLPGFPPAPTWKGGSAGQITAQGGVVWVWNGRRWDPLYVIQTAARAGGFGHPSAFSTQLSAAAGASDAALMAVISPGRTAGIMSAGLAINPFGGPNAPSITSIAGLATNPFGGQEAAGYYGPQGPFGSQLVPSNPFASQQAAILPGTAPWAGAAAQAPPQLTYPMSPFGQAPSQGSATTFAPVVPPVGWQAPSSNLKPIYLQPGYSPPTQPQTGPLPRL